VTVASFVATPICADLSPGSASSAALTLVVIIVSSAPASLLPTEDWSVAP
jgi:hypothetical protein